MSYLSGDLSPPALQCQTTQGEGRYEAGRLGNVNSGPGVGIDIAGCQ
jgi:hypothetical protein